MQYNVNPNNIIIMNRGDTYSFDFVIGDTDSPTGRYTLQEGDAVYFGLMLPHQPFEEAILRKRITCDTEGAIDNDRITVTIYPDDTIDLEPGVYYYAVKIRHPALPRDEVFTIINKTKFVIND